jgi:putative tryptophan/tyrosine transport system substrate-binding protein
MTAKMKRREFITLLGGAAAWPLAARAQQPAMPVVGFLNGLSAGERPHLVESFRRGLSEAGYVAGQNVAVEYRYAENQPDRLRALAADLIARRVVVIAATGGNHSALVAKSLTTTIPIVFTSGADPVRAGLVSSFSQPEGNVTGVSWFSVDLGAKHLELVREFVPAATLIAVIVNPRNREAVLYEQPLREAAARVPGLQMEILEASTAGEIDAAFETLMQHKASAVIVASDPFLTARARQFAVLAARNNIAMVTGTRDFTMAGCMISYGNDTADAYRRAGLYAGRILKGAKPRDLPIDRATKFELIINVQTARTLKFEIPARLLATADEVIE